MSQLDDLFDAPVPVARTIVIEIGPPEANYFTIREGDRYVDRLCWDEALGSLAELTHPRIGEARYSMRTAEQHAEEDRRRRERSLRWDAEEVVEETGSDLLLRAILRGGAEYFPETGPDGVQRGFVNVSSAISGRSRSWTVAIDPRGRPVVEEALAAALREAIA